MKRNSPTLFCSRIRKNSVVCHRSPKPDDFGYDGTDRRSAYSLVEMVVAIGLISMIMAISATLFAAMSRSERNVLRSAAAQQTLGRLNELFRRDVHAAVSATVSQTEDQQPLLTLKQADDSTVRYTVAAGILERDAQINGGVHHESYRIADATWSFQLDDDTRRVTVTLQRPGDTITQVTQDFLPTRTWRLTAVRSLTPMTIPAKGDAP